MLKQHYSAINRSQSIAGFTQRVERQFAPTPTTTGQKEPFRRWTMRQKLCSRRDRTKTDQQVTSHQQRPARQKSHRARRAGMEGEGSTGKGGRARGNVSEESQDKRKLPQSANISLSNSTYPALSHQQQTNLKQKQTVIYYCVDD